MQESTLSHPAEITIFRREQEPEILDSLESLPKLDEDCFAWIDIQTDQQEDLEKLADVLGLHELTIEDCLTPGHLPKLEDYGSYLFLIFRGLKSWGELEEIWEREEDDTLPERHDAYTRKVAIFLSDNYMITFRRREVAWLDAILRQVRSSGEQPFALGPDGLAHRVVDVLIDRFLRALTFFERIIDRFEDVALERPEDFELSELLELKRDLSFLRQIMRDQRSVISKLSTERTLIGERQRRRYFRDIDDHALTIITLLDKKIESLLGIRDSYIAVSNVRLGDTMRILTVITTIAAPLHLVVGLYGMNFEVIPLLKDPDGFWIIVFLMLAVAGVMLAFFRSRRWI